MDILLTTGIGEGATELSAFDRALYEAGIANLNLIQLSSVLPPKSLVIHKRPEIGEEHWGDKLYCVLAEQRTHARGLEVWAGIGWVQDEETSQGLFVEHHGHSRDEVESLINESLASMTLYRPRPWGSIQSTIVGTSCLDRPVCALVAAVYVVRGWQ